MEVLIGTSSINGPFSMAMLNNQRVSLLAKSPYQVELSLYNSQVQTLSNHHLTISESQCVWLNPVHVLNIVKSPWWVRYRLRYPRKNRTTSRLLLFFLMGLLSYVYIYICVYICIYICIYIYVYAVYMYVYIYAVYIYIYTMILLLNPLNPLNTQGGQPHPTSWM